MRIILNRILLKLIGFIEVFGGLWGISIMLYRMADVLDNFRVLFYMLLYLLPFILSLIAGILLLQKKRSGIDLSLAVQALQIPYFAVAGWYYSFISGALLGVRVSFFEKATHYSFNFLAGGYCQIQNGLPEGISAFGINIFAIILLIILVRQKNSKN